MSDTPRRFFQRSVSEVKEEIFDEDAMNTPSPPLVILEVQLVKEREERERVEEER